jgi:hypothetical protein
MAGSTGARKLLSGSSNRSRKSMVQGLESFLMSVFYTE